MEGNCNALVTDNVLSNPALLNVILRAAACMDAVGGTSMRAASAVSTHWHQVIESNPSLWLIYPFDMVQLPKELITSIERSAAVLKVLRTSGNNQVVIDDDIGSEDDPTECYITSADVVVPNYCTMTVARKIYISEESSTQLTFVFTLLRDHPNFEADFESELDTDEELDANQHEIIHLGVEFTSDPSMCLIGEVKAAFNLPKCFSSADTLSALAFAAFRGFNWSGTEGVDDACQGARMKWDYDYAVDGLAYCCSNHPWPMNQCENSSMDSERNCKYCELTLPEEMYYMLHSRGNENDALKQRLRRMKKRAGGGR